MSWFEIIFLCCFFLFSFMFMFTILYSISHGHEPISEIELDATTCYQMRKSGCSEEEIKKFMDDHNGYYDLE